MSDATARPADGLPPLSRNQLKQYKRLKTRRGRREVGKFLLEGIRVVAAAVNEVAIEQIIHTPELLGTADGRALRERLAHLPWREARGTWLEQLADAQTAQGVLAVAKLPRPAFTPAAWRRVLLLDRVQDPGNVGTLLRAARAFAFDAVLALPGTADFFSSKVLRASAGFGLGLPLLAADASYLAALRAVGFAFYWGNPHGGLPVQQAAWRQPLALWAGNEARGLDAAAQAQATGITIPCAAGIESLNVSLATAMLMQHIFTTGEN